MRSSENFHYPFGRNFPFSVLNQPCSCGVYSESHSAKGNGNKAAVRTVEVGPFMKAVCLASLSAFWFPQAIVVLVSSVVKLPPI
jgi:hypothetical protein